MALVMSSTLLNKAPILLLLNELFAFILLLIGDGDTQFMGSISLNLKYMFVNISFIGDKSNIKF